MQEATGRFVGELDAAKWHKDTGESLPTLGIGEVVEIKGVRFRVKAIKENGKLMLKMVKRTTQEEIEAANVAKLRARFPKGWSPEAQRAKADEVRA